MFPEIPANAPSWVFLVVLLVWAFREVYPRLAGKSAPSSQPPPGFNWDSFTAWVEKQKDNEPATKGDLARIESKVDELAKSFLEHCEQKAA